VFGQTELTAVMCANSDKPGVIGIPDTTFFDVRVWNSIAFLRYALTMTMSN